MALPFRGMLPARIWCRDVAMRPVLLLMASAGLLACHIGVAAPDTESNALAWLAGHWCGVGSHAGSEELWLTPARGELLGLSRSLRDGEMSAFEYLRIVHDDDQTYYVAQPGGRPPTRFALSDAGAQWVRFDNPAHDFPQRIEYRREGEALTATISGPGSDGAEQRIEFLMRRCQKAPARGSAS
jgi:hypothetical protein